MVNSDLWKKSLSPNGDEYDTHRERYRQALFSFRDRIGQLVSTIPFDMKGYTVHDLSHLDALWHMADILTSGNYELNPAEAFVFGGAILLHDSGMTVAAYKGGVEEVKRTVEYADALAQLKASRVGGSENASSLLANLEELALVDALRLNHAAKAENLATLEWTSPLDGAPIFLLEDADLRDHFGRCIGRIAHSHHWDANEIPKKLSVSLGAFSGSPSSWTVNQIKIALLLRCVDAMHIDDRRAPKLLFSTWKPVGISAEHWKFQNKLAQPHLNENKIVYTSKTPFGLEESVAWHLCFDVISMIDKELRAAEDLQKTARIPLFSANGVEGASSADALSKYIEVNGWRPLPLNLQVSNVSSLAKTLGGRDLYNFPLAPLRELIQNAADAVEARAYLDSDFSINDGLITVRISETRDTMTIEIEDNGIGMSEKTLTSALLDFGFSFWRSSEARAEFPGLQKSSTKFRGRYGIGFFSVFMWSDKVVVSSKRFSDGIDQAKCLDFRSGLDTRPILRPAGEGERSTKWNTRVSLQLKSGVLKQYLNPERYRYSFRHYDPPYPSNWAERLKLICGALPIKVVLEHGNVKSPVSLVNWKTCPPSELFDFFSGIILSKDETNFRFASNLTNLSENMPTTGRCFISPYNRERNMLAIYEKGIFIATESYNQISGIVETETTNAARDRFSGLSIKSDEKWISEVRSKTFSSCQHIGEILVAQKLFLELGFPDSSQPMFIKNRRFVSHTEVIREIEQSGKLTFTLSEVDQDRFGCAPYEVLSPITGLDIDEHRIFPLITLSGSVGLNENITTAIKTRDEPLFTTLRDYLQAIGPEPEVKNSRYEVEGYRKDYLFIQIRRTS